MLPKQHRVTVPEFFRNPNPAKRFEAQIFTLVIKPSQNLGARVGIMVQKRLDKRASHRNRTRRMAVESIRPILGAIKPSVDALIKLKRVVKKEERIMLQEELAKLLRNSGYYEI